jgi:hypothetical protein
MSDTFQSGTYLGDMMASIMGTPTQQLPDLSQTDDTGEQMPPGAAPAFPGGAPPMPQPAPGQNPHTDPSTDPFFTGDPDSPFAGPPAPSAETLGGTLAATLAPPQSGGSAMNATQSQVSTPNPPPAFPGGAPMLTPAPSQPPQGAPPLPPPTNIPAPTPPPPISTDTGPTVPSAPNPAATSPPGPPSPGRGWLSNIFGSDARSNRQVVGSLGEGLKSVGQNWNKPGLAAFAGSAGSAIEGGQKADIEFDKQKDRLEDRIVKARSLNDRKAYDDARIQLQMLKVQEAQQKGTVSSRNLAYQNSDAAKLHTADQDVQKAMDREMLTRKTEYDGLNTEGQKALRAEWDQKKKQLQDETYRARGIDPDKIRQRGTGFPGQDGKLDIPKTTEYAHRPQTVDEFHATVKKGDYYIDEKGALRRRRDDPPAPVPDNYLQDLGPRTQPGTITAAGSPEDEAA